MGFSLHHNFFSGSLEVICGPMFSGKTEELIRRVKRARIARQKIQIFKPKTDDRYDVDHVVSHSEQKIEAVAIDKASDILHNLHDSTRVIAIDEVQFFDEGILAIIDRLVRRGHRVICAGLDLDYRSRPFGCIPDLLAMADDVTKIQAICTVCGAWATKTQRTKGGTDQIQVGLSDSYEARCRLHYEELSYLDDGMQAIRMPLDLGENPLSQ